MVRLNLNNCTSTTEEHHQAGHPPVPSEWKIINATQVQSKRRIFSSWMVRGGQRHRGGGERWTQLSTEWVNFHSWRKRGGQEEIVPVTMQGWIVHYLRICLGEQSRVVRAQSPCRGLLGEKEEKGTGSHVLRTSGQSKACLWNPHWGRSVFVLTVKELRKEMSA